MLLVTVNPTAVVIGHGARRWADALFFAGVHADPRPPRDGSRPLVVVFTARRTRTLRLWWAIPTTTTDAQRSLESVSCARPQLDDGYQAAERRVHLVSAIGDVEGEDDPSTAAAAASLLDRLPPPTLSPTDRLRLSAARVECAEDALAAALASRAAVAANALADGIDPALFIDDTDAQRVAHRAIRGPGVFDDPVAFDARFAAIVDA